VQNAEQAEETNTEIKADYKRHTRKARERAEEYPDVEKVMIRLPREVNLI
jgi:hypothetical protein